MDKEERKAQEARLHKVLAGFGATTLTRLKRKGFFEGKVEALPNSFYRALAKESKAKNAEAFEIIFDSYSTPALQAGKAQVNKMLGFSQPIQTITRQEAWVDRYYGIRKPEFVKLMTRTDLQRVRRLTSEEVLELHSLIDENRFVNERDFARALKDSYICDGDKVRLARCKRMESHYANSTGKFAYAVDVGAEEKHRLTAGDDKVRETHELDSAAGWIPINQPYPFSGEMAAGDTDIGCRCADQFRFKRS